MRLTDKEVDTIIHHGMRRLKEGGELEGWVEAGAGQGRGWRCFWLAVLATGCLGLVGLAKAASIQTAAITCANCTTMDQLAGQALLHSEAYPIPGTVIVVVSLNAPIAGAFQNTGLKSCPPGPGIQLVCIPILKPLVGQSCAATDKKCQNMAAAYYSEVMFARAAKIDFPITAPFAWPAVDSSVSLQIENTITATGQYGVETYHLLVPGPDWPSVQYWTYTINLPGIGAYSTDIFVGDFITVTFNNGFSVSYQFQGSNNTKSKRWVAVPGTVMKNGKPYVPPPPAPATPQGGFASADGNSVWGRGARVLTQLDFNSCAGVTSVTVTTETGSTTYYGNFGFPCAIP